MKQAKDWTIDMLVEYRDSIDLSGKGQKHRYAMVDRVINGMTTHGVATVESRTDGNIGQWVESLAKAVKHNYSNGFYSRANSADTYDGNGAWEIKATTSPNSKATPLTKAQRVLFVSYLGVCTLSKKQVAELMESQDTRYVLPTPDGIRLKAQCVEIGRPVAWLNKVLGF